MNSLFQPRTEPEIENLLLKEIARKVILVVGVLKKEQAVCSLGGTSHTLARKISRRQ